MDFSYSTSLALNGGQPIHQGGWPQWPRYGPKALELLKEVLDSGRWAVSGTWTGAQPMDVVFADEFARFIGSKHCIPTDHCSSALIMSLKALGVGPGDEVIVPGLTWVACASTVLRVNATPILVDVEPGTQCISPAAVAAAITPRTAAILVVHLYSAMAQLDELTAIADRHGIPIIEDCAQVHGATWRGRRAGTIGKLGTFSMQQGKVLTCGEGGAVVTSDSHLHRLLEQLRNDGRCYSSELPQIGQMHLEEIGEIMGANRAMSEFQASVLLDGLARLDEENNLRAVNADYLTGQLGKLEGLDFIRPYPQNDQRTYYHYVVRYEPEAFAQRPVELICRALEAELGFWVHQTYRPLNDHPLYRPHLDTSCLGAAHCGEKLNPARFELNEARRQHQRSILFHHSVLLGRTEDMDHIAEAFEKVQRFASSLPASS